MQEINSKRDYSIDWLKAIGTLCLFLAHVNAPFWINEIRGFDVPLMVFLSAILAEGSLSRASSSLSYIAKRIKRLVIPTWIFLVFFYLCMASVNQLPSIGTVVKSFLFQRDGGIAGYTWIIWIYIICSLLTPVLTKINQKNLVLFLPIVIAYEMACFYTNWSENRIMYYTFFTVIPYGLFLLYALNFKKHPDKVNVINSLIIALVHIGYAWFLFKKYTAYVPIGEYKYPARFYYFSYAIPIITCMYLTFKASGFCDRYNRVITFISKNSLWIYLWHIFTLAILKYVLKVENWVVSYIILVLASLGITYVQTTFVRYLMRKHNIGFLKYLRG